MNLVEVVILVGAQCLSPMESGEGVTEVGKVRCAVLVLQDPATAEVDFVPPSAATDPAVIAMLVKPRPGAPPPKSDSLAATDGPVIGSISRAPRIVPTSGGVDAEDEPGPGPPSTAGKKSSAKPAAARKRSDTCGSYRAVWYTNKEGRKRYRCVRQG